MLLAHFTAKLTDIAIKTNVKHKVVFGNQLARQMTNNSHVSTCGASIKGKKTTTADKEVWQ